MDPLSRMVFVNAAGVAGLPEIGDAYEGGYYGGLISHTADGNATHALIIAPKASGAGGEYYGGAGLKQLQNNSTSYGNNSWYDGAYNCAQVPEANSALITFTNALTIGGYTDWYLPAVAEMQILYYNLKSTTTNNVTNSGSNDYSVPKRTSNYTTTDPAMVSVAAFQYPSGAEAFYGGTNVPTTDKSRFTASHWTSTERTGAAAWYIKTSDQHGALDSTDKNITIRTLSFCAIRRVAL